MKTTAPLIYLTVSILVSLFMIFLDPIAVATSEETVGIMMYLVLVGLLITVIYSILFMLGKITRNGISITALIVTVINTFIIGLLLLFGALFA